MNETTKTFAFVGAGLLSLVAAVATRPRSTEFQPNQYIGKDLTTAVEPDEAKGLKVVEFDEDNAALRTFEVANRDGLWAIPSKDGYPADGEEQMAKAVNGAIDLEILDIVGTTAAEHEQYGVIEPNDKLEVGQKGVGKRVTLAKEDGSAITDLIIGKSVKGSDAQRYVRKANQDVVYVVEIDPASFSTKFENWIEADLLKINSWDLQTVQLDNYSASAQVGMTPDGQLTARLVKETEARMALAYDDTKGEWSPKLLENYDKTDKKYVPFELTDKEELDKDKLQALKTALDDLKIVDVDHKPEGLSGDLQAGADFLKNEAALESLQDHGFIPAMTKTGVEIVSTQGEFLATMKDGVEYVLRFGDLKMTSASGEAAEEKPAAGDTKPKGEGVDRYLFVMTRFNESAIAKPELEELPELPADAAKEGEADKKPEDKPTTEEKTEDQKADAKAEAAEGEKKAEETAKLDELIAQRKEIETRNQQKLDEYNQKIKDAQKRVTELNARFGDWYYVISDEVYKKIRLAKSDVIKQKAAEEKKEGEAVKKDEKTSDFGAPGADVPGVPAVPAAP